MATATRPTRKYTSRPLGRDASRQKPEIITCSYEHQPFRRLNFYLMAGCVCLIVLGFLLMLGGGSSVEGGFNPDVFSTRRIVIGPAITFLGFLLMAFAIIYNKKGKKAGKEASPETKE